MTDSTNLHEKIEYNANIVLWCMHVLGPDDVIPMVSYSDALKTSKEHNQALFELIDQDQNNILCFAYPAPWPHDAQSHADAMLEARKQ